MSDLESFTNNQHPPQKSPVQYRTEHYSRDTEYYSEGGSVVFLADNVLFKVSALRFAADPGVTDYEFKALVKDALDHSKMSLNKPGCDDAHPIILPNVTATQFRRFLLAILGRIGDSGYTSFITAAQEPSSHGPTLVGHLTDTGTLAMRFGMFSLDTWVYSQLLMVLRHTPSAAINSLPSVVTYMKATHVGTSRDEVSAWVELIIWLSFKRSEDPETSRLSVFVDWYRDQSLAEKSPRLFGYLFIVILSLGHLSHVWNNILTRDERRIFYAANTVLVRLCDHGDLEVEWLSQPTFVKDICSQPACTRNFDKYWSSIFGQHKSLGSSVALEDIHRIVLLPKHRYQFAKQSESWKCESQCAQKTLAKIDTLIGRLFLGFATKQKLFASTA